MKVLKYLVHLIFGALILVACNKDDSDPVRGNELGTGTIFYNWATEGIQKIELNTGIKSTVVPDNSSPDDWDISLNAEKILKVSDPTDQDYDARLYTYSKIDDGTIISQFKYYPAEGDYTTGYLSPDESKIAVAPTFDDGIVLLDLQGNILYQLESFNGEELRRDTHIAWMPDGTLLFTTQDAIYRTNLAFTQGTLIKTMNIEDWGHTTVSRDGNRIALRSGNHIWIMDSDGSNFVQVTTSDAVEAYPVFSPDGKFLLVGTDFHTTGPFGYIWYLKIVPLDGQMHNVNDGADPKVIPVIAKGETSAEAGSGNMLWR